MGWTQCVIYENKTKQVSRFQELFERTLSLELLKRTPLTAVELLVRTPSLELYGCTPENRSVRFQELFEHTPAPWLLKWFKRTPLPAVELLVRTLFLELPGVLQKTGRACGVA